MSWTKSAICATPRTFGRFGASAKAENPMAKIAAASDPDTRVFFMKSSKNNFCRHSKLPAAAVLTADSPEGTAGRRHVGCIEVRMIQGVKTVGPQLEVQ